MDNKVTSKNIVKTLEARYGTKPLLQHYAQDALNAAKRAKNAITTQNAYAVGVEAEKMASLIETIYMILHKEEPDTLSPDEEKSKK